VHESGVRPGSVARGPAATALISSFEFRVTGPGESQCQWHRGSHLTVPSRMIRRAALNPAAASTLRRRDCGALGTLGPGPCRLAAQPEDLYPQNILSFDRPPGHWHSAGGSRRGAAVTVSLKAPPLPPLIPRRIAVRSAGYMRYYKLPRPAAARLFAIRRPRPRATGNTRPQQSPVGSHQTLVNPGRLSGWATDSYMVRALLSGCAGLSPLYINIQTSTKYLQECTKRKQVSVAEVPKDTKQINAAKSVEIADWPLLFQRLSKD